MLIDGQSEGSLTGKQAHGISKEFIKGSRCTYIFLHNSLNGLLTGAM